MSRKEIIFWSIWFGLICPILLIIYFSYHEESQKAGTVGSSTIPYNFVSSYDDIADQKREDPPNFKPIIRIEEFD